jgi:hypothetical protein
LGDSGFQHLDEKSQEIRNLISRGVFVQVSNENQSTEYKTILYGCLVVIFLIEANKNLIIGCLSKKLLYPI